MVTIVTGLPRSGTSLMMQMLRAGGMELLVDDVRRPDEDNPEGYYEFEAVKRTRADASWLDSAEGKAVKMVYLLLYDLPAEPQYKVLIMERDLGEVIVSQNKMLARLGRAPSRLSDAELIAAFRDDLRKLKAWLAERPQFEVMSVNYNELLQSPGRWADGIVHFLGMPLDVARMIGAINLSLYRQRRGGSHV
jgi:hypothetical protein